MWKDYGEWGQFAFSASTIADLMAAYSTPAFWVNRQGQDWAIFNPKVFVEASAQAEVTLKLGLVHLILNFKLMGFRWTPLEYQLAWDLDKKDRACYSISYLQEVADFSVTPSIYVNECSAGLFGLIAKQANLF